MQRYKVRDGYHFQFLTEIRDAKGNIHNFSKDGPAGPGSVIEVQPEQVLGQEHKLELVEALTLKCNNSGCEKEFETKAINLAYAWCPHCGGRGGEVIEAKVKTKRSKKDKDRQDLSEDEKREPVIPDPPPSDGDADVEEEKPTRGKRKKGK